MNYCKKTHGKRVPALFSFYTWLGPACKGTGIQGHGYLGSPENLCIHDLYRNWNFNGTDWMDYTNI